MRSFKAVMLLGLLAATAWPVAAAALALGVLLPLASACLQACAGDPVLMGVSRGLAASSVVVTAAGFVVGLVVLLRQLRSTRRLVLWMETHAIPLPRSLQGLAAELGLAGRLTCVPDPTPYAFCHGFLSPGVCVSSGLGEILTELELRAVLIHERSHLRHRDPLRVLASRVVAGALFPLPVVADLRDRYLLEKELAADDRVVSEISSGPLASALLKLYRAGGGRPVASLAAAAVGPFGVVGERVRHLARPSEPPPQLRTCRVVASVAAAALLLLGAVGSALATERSLPPGGACCATSSLCSVGER